MLRAFALLRSHTERPPADPGPAPAFATTPPRLTELKSVRVRVMWRTAGERPNGSRRSERAQHIPTITLSGYHRYYTVVLTTVNRGEIRISVRTEGCCARYGAFSNRGYRNVSIDPSMWQSTRGGAPRLSRDSDVMTTGRTSVLTAHRSPLTSNGHENSAGR